MATANFASVNTSKIFAFGANKYITQEDIDANDWPQEWLGQFDECQTQSDAEWCQESAVSMLKEKGWDDSEGWDGDRNYPGSNIAEKTVCVVVCGLSLDIKVTAKTVSGYYSGATFDWDGNLKVYDREGYYVSDYDLTGNYAVDESDVISENWTGNNGLSKIQAKNIIRRVYSEFQKLTDEAEEVFQACSEHRLGCVGHFSNGEAVYEDLDTVRGQLKLAVC